mmetsp:Transcript_11739/g.21357  ORF Transcript_11739/g.21357 Transcript_11739/m.21357 type:complete len:260 (+) Transcript_11739:129-908(+)
MSFDPSWSSKDLAHALCDVLVAKNQLKDKPAFIREDREAKIAGIFQSLELDGQKMSQFDNPGPLEMIVRKGTSGEAWVQQVIDALIGMLPKEAAAAAKKMNMDDTTKEELAAAKEKSAQRRERLQETEGENRPPPPPSREGEPREGGRGGREPREGGGGRVPGNRDREHPRESKMDTSTMECYNCGGMGHSSRDCPEPRKEKGKGKSKGREQQQCFNCKGFGHRSRDCPEPPDEELVRQRLAARAEKEREARESVAAKA